MRKLIGSVGAGFLGALAMAAADGYSRRRWKIGQPRLEQLRERAIVRVASAIGAPRLRGKRLARAVLAANVVASSIFFAALLMRRSERPLLRGAIGGTLAGLASVLFPALLGLGERPRRLSPRNQAVTVAGYTLGGLAAATAWRGLGTRPVIWS